MANIKVIIPAYNEAACIGLVVRSLPLSATEIIVVNNNSSDNTAEVAAKTGATVLDEPSPGYGNACLRGLAYIASLPQQPDIVVFVDGDFSDYGEEMDKLVQPIVEEGVDLVIGARVPELREKHAMTPQQVWGNKLATFLMRIFYGSRFTDLGPFRAIRYDKLLALDMEDKNYGWTVEMQLKALKKNYVYREVPVHYRTRIGISKISGTLKGTILAGYKIIGWIIKYSFAK